MGTGIIRAGFLEEEGSLQVVKTVTGRKLEEIRLREAQAVDLKFSIVSIGIKLKNHFLHLSLMNTPGE